MSKRPVVGGKKPVTLPPPPEVGPNEGEHKAERIDGKTVSVEAG